ncbi:ABC transporter ATP-binding protein [Paracoccus binzhouensis]|uniref:ABC transporter ATP-binding protein n=1 Tax=Paracoccus binzhouensis TaxID=2796149 RepID=UPI0018EF0150|nr:ATP-binding cassette domain-containing protein [Paracoccus binzhouensis]
MPSELYRNLNVHAAVELREISRSFGPCRAIDRLDLTIRPGEFVALLGAPGSGKSTLLRILGDLDRGFQGEALVASRRAIAFPPPRLTPWKRLWRNVLRDLPGRPDRGRAQAALAEVGIAHRADAWPRRLSQAETQRAALAHALLGDPDLLLLDEPFAGLDALSRGKAQALLAGLWRRHRCAVLLATRDAEEAALLADRVLVMRQGAIIHQERIALDRPRDPADPDFARLRGRLLDWLGVVPGAH